MYREEEKLCLKRNDFQENAISAFGTMREDSHFADVTLASEDGHQVEAHKVILASSSPFFLNILKRTNHPHPLIYMRGLKSEDLVPMIDFLYYGEANINQGNLDSFLALAQELKLKGLMGSGDEEEVEEAHIKNSQKTYVRKSSQKTFFSEEGAIIPDIPNSVDTLESPVPQEGALAVNDFNVTAELQNLNEKIKSMMEITEKNIRIGNENQNRKVYACKICGKEGAQATIIRHVESNHITGASHICNICGHISWTRNALQIHKRSKHNNTT